MKKPWCIPPQATAEFVCQLEEVLDVYTRPDAPDCPTVCFDETNKPLIGETRTLLPPQPGQPQRDAYEYERNGVNNLFLFFAPLQHWRHVQGTPRRTKADWADCMQELGALHCPQAPCLRVVQDNLNTPIPSALYEVFHPAEAKRLLNRLEFHDTPKHGSWLNMAEIELSGLSRQCLDRRIPDTATLKREVAAWEQARNTQQATVHWRFTTADARMKLKRLSPSIQT